MSTRYTELRAVHDELGATWTEFAGWSMPLKYRSEVAEHRAVRTAAGIFDLSHMCEVEIIGGQAAPALDFALVGRPSAMRSGQARYSMLVDEFGGILDDVIVYRLADDRYLVVANAGNASLVEAELRSRCDGYRARVETTSDEWALIGVQGPNSALILAEAAGTGTPALKYYTFAKGFIGPHPVLCARTGYTGEIGFELYCATSAAVDVWTRLRKSGDRHGLMPAGLASRNSLRLEAGMPLYGHELTRDVTPLDVGLGRLVDFDKPCHFIGYESLLRARDVAPVRKLVGLSGPTKRAPRAGDAVLTLDGSRRVGTITSGLPSPTLGHAIAMAMLDDPAAADCDKLTIDIRRRPETFNVVQMPFYRRPPAQQPTHRLAERVR